MMSNKKAGDSSVIRIKEDGGVQINSVIENINLTCLNVDDFKISPYQNILLVQSLDANVIFWCEMDGKEAKNLNAAEILTNFSTNLNNFKALLKSIPYAPHTNFSDVEMIINKERLLDFKIQLKWLKQSFEFGAVFNETRRLKITSSDFEVSFLFNFTTYSFLT
jgi:hypothetical protein